jgi:hypothetical protein
MMRKLSMLRSIGQEIGFYLQENEHMAVNAAERGIIAI